MAKNYNNDFQAPAVVREPVDTVLARLGIADERNRAFIMSQAAVMKVDAGLLDIPENIAEVVKSAKYTQEYGFMPGIHLHMQTFKTNATRKLPNGATTKVWEERITLVVGEQAYKASARQHAAAERDYIDFETEEMTHDEVAAYVTANLPGVELTDEDRGARARVLSYKGAQIAGAMGKKYDPEWSYGFCFMKGVPRVGDDGKRTYPKSDRDRIPNQRTALDVAIRRAVKSAVMRKYPLVPLDNRNAEQRMAQVLDLAATDSTAEDARHRAPVLDKDIQYEEDGDILYATTQHRNVVAGQPIEEEGAFRQADEPPAPVIDRVEPGGEADPDNPFDNPDLGVAAEETRDYAAIANRLTGKTRELADWASKLHGKSKGDASKAQYGFLCKEINKHTGDAHTHVLSVLCRQHISGSHPCGADLASKLLDVILTEVPQTDAAGAKVKANGKQVYVANPRFRQDIVDHLKEIAQAK